MGGLWGSGIYSECCFTSSNAFSTFLTNSIVFFSSLSKGWVTCVCPCLTFARNAEIVDEGRPSKQILLIVLWYICMGLYAIMGKVHYHTHVYAISSTKNICDLS